MPGRRTAIGILTLLAALASTVAALDPSKPLSQYSRALWTTANGLPDNFVQALIQTRDGYLWLGTTEGLVRFDGTQFTVFDTRNTPAMRHNSVIALCQDRRGTLWIGTSGGGIVLYRDGRFTATYDTANGLPNNYIRSIYEDRGGDIWITAHAGGLVRFRDGRFQIFNKRDGLPSDSLRTLFQDSRGDLWIGTDEDGMCLMQGRSIRCSGKESGLRSNQIRAIHEDRQGRLWVGTRAGGLHVLEGGRFRPVAGIAAVAVRAIVEDRHGNLWIGTEGAGLWRMQQGRIARLTPREGLPHSFVRAMLEDSEGNLWLGTRGGLFRLRDKKVETWTTTEGLVNDDVRVLLAEPSGRVWFGTRAGLSLLDHGAVRPIRLSREWTRDVVRTLARTPDGVIWIGADTGLFRVRGGSVARVKLPLPDEAPAVRVLFADSRGRLWIGLWNRLYVYERGRLSDAAAKIAQPLSGVNALAEDRDGTLWIGTEEGLYALKDHAATRFTSREGLSHDRVTSLYADSGGALWIGTRGGLTRLRDGRFACFRRRDGLLSDNILQVAEDRFEHLWLTSRRGIMRVRKQELEEFAEKRRDYLRAVSFDTSDGMRSAECNGAEQPAAAMTPDGRMWFPTVAGAVVFDPRSLRETPAPPRIVMERVISEGKVWPAGAGSLRLGAGSSDLEIQFTAISLGAPERVRFRYRLDGYDEGWVESGGRRFASYTNLPPGQYRFRAIAFANDGSWPREEASLELTLEPHFYQTAWFYLLCGCALLALAWMAHRARMLSVHRRYAAVLEERARIAREIHDTLMQGVTGVSLQLEAASRRLPEDPHEAKSRMERALTRLDEVVAEARRTILELRSTGCSEADAESALQEMAARISEEHGVQIQLKVEGQKRALPPPVCVQLAKIAREAAVNAVRHSRASSVTLVLRYEATAVRLLACDDGRGFDPARTGESHFGLTGMRERARSIGGSVEIHSRPGAGTEVEVRVPVRSGARGVE